MKLFKVERTDSWSYDDYDSFVCIAPTEEAARWMFPSEYRFWEDGKLYFLYADGTRKQEDPDYPYSSWTMKPETLKVTELGEALENKSQVILASFNPG